MLIYSHIETRATYFFFNLLWKVKTIHGIFSNYQSLEELKMGLGENNKL